MNQKIQLFQNQIRKIRIGLSSPGRIKKWAERKLPNGSIIGEIKTPDTLNYKTFKPQSDGLFCERIFGPVNDFVCACGKTQPDSKQKFCEICGVEFTLAQVRRYRLGYIKLASPVSHIWYLKSVPSYISVLTGIPKTQIETVVYCEAGLSQPTNYNTALIKKTISNKITIINTNFLEKILDKNKNTSKNSLLELGPIYGPLKKSILKKDPKSTQKTGSNQNYKKSTRLMVFQSGFDRDGQLVGHQEPLTKNKEPTEVTDGYKVLKNPIAAKKTVKNEKMALGLKIQTKKKNNTNRTFYFNFQKKNLKRVNNVDPETHISNFLTNKQQNFNDSDFVTHIKIPKLSYLDFTNYKVLGTYIEKVTTKHKSCKIPFSFGKKAKMEGFLPEPITIVSKVKYDFSTKHPVFGSKNQRTVFVEPDNLYQRTSYKKKKVLLIQVFGLGQFLKTNTNCLFLQLKKSIVLHLFQRTLFF